jgi:hypothetical protein
VGTFVRYRGLINKHLIPGLGHLRLRDLRPEHVDRLLRAKADMGMARSSVGRLRSILTDALTHAERRQLVPRNVGRLSIMPWIPESEEQRALTATERERFIATAVAFHPATLNGGVAGRTSNSRLLPGRGGQRQGSCGSAGAVAVQSGHPGATGLDHQQGPRSFRATGPGPGC